MADRDALRAGLGYRPDEKVCVVTVGGSGVGEHLLRKVVDSYDAAEWLTVQGPYREPAAAYEHAQELVGQLRYAPPLRTRRTRRDCTRRPTARP